MAAIRFETYGWNARIGAGFDESGVVRVSDAVARTWAERYEGSTVLIGYDTRRDSRRLAEVAGQVLSAHGLVAVVSDAVCPTPALGWAVAHDPSCVGGLMITASRRPCTYGGIRVRQADGGPVSALFARTVDQRIEAEPTAARGPISHADLVSAYLNHIERETDTELVSRAGLKVVLDPLYGAGCGYAQRLLERIGCEVVVAHGQPVPDFRGLHPHAGEPWVDECERLVMAQHADMGIVLNGDCSRNAIIDETGRLVSAHDIAPLVLEHIVRQRGSYGRVVATAASSVRIERQAERLDCDFTRVPVGFDSIYREFQDGDVILGTEEMGGICIPQHMPERDGLLGSVMLTEYVAGAGEGVRALVQQCEAEIGAMEYMARDIRLDFGQSQRLGNLLPGLNPPEVLGEQPVMVTHPSGLRVELADGSWVLLRLASSGAGARAACEAPTVSRASALLLWALGAARS